MPALIAEVRRLRAEHAAALDAARREGAEGMRAACARIARAHVGQQGMRAPAPQWVDVGERIAAQIEERG